MAPSPADDLSLAERVDAGCDRFEAAYQSGQQPRLEDYLGGAVEPLRIQLFRGLLELELELQRQQGKKPPRDDYVARFPQYAAIVDLVYAESSDGSSRRLTKKPAVQESSVQGTADTFHSPRATERRETSEHPEKIGRFQIQQVLGEGAFGAVYKARDPQLDRDIALKVLHTGNHSTNEERERFLREARAAAGLHHPSICPVYEVGVTPDGRDYLIMAFIEGKTLAKVIQSGAKLTERQIAIAIRKLAMALDEAHQKGVIHRDLKPGNIMINRKGEPVIMDFGLARRDNPSDPQISQSGQIMGTPAYMSPEQARGDSKRVGPAADQYSLGVVFYELLSGQRPFTGTVTEVIGKILHIEPLPPSTVRKTVDRRLEAICMKSIEKEPAKRYGSLKELAASLTEFLKSSGATATSSDAAAEPPAIDEPLNARQIARLVDAVSADVESKVNRAARRAVRRVKQKLGPPWWTYLIGSATVGLIVLFGILFFIRKDTVTVVVNIPIDIQDPALSFVLDQRAVTAEQLAAPIELKPGEHELIVNKDGQLFKRFVFGVALGNRDPVVPQDVTPKTEEGWVDLFNGQDLTGWESDTDASSFRVDPQAQTLVVSTIKPGSKLRRHWLFTTADYGDYLLRLEFLCVDHKVKSAVAIKGKLGTDPEYNIELAIQVRDSKPAPGRPTGSLVINGVDGVTPTKLPRQNPDGEWNALEIKVQGSVVAVTLNGDPVHDVDLAKIDRAGLHPEAVANLDRRPGRIGLQSMEGTIKYRNLRLRDLSPPSRNDYRRAFGMHAYRYMNESRTWAEALQRCERLSGRLAVVDSPEKNAFLAQLMADSNGQEAWISATSDKQAGTWTTTSGKPLSYANWQPSEPRSGALHALMAGGTATAAWRSADNEHRAGFFIEWDLPAGSRTSSATGSNWTSLFNGKDLEGWTMHPDGPANPWKVEQGILTADFGQPLSLLVTTRGDYRDVHVRAEALLERGVGGIKVRVPFDASPFATSYTANLVGERFGKKKQAATASEAARVTIFKPPPDTWVTLEIIVTGYHVTVLVDGQTIDEYDDPDQRRASGHIGLPWGPNTKISFRKIEVNDLSPAATSSVPPDARIFQGHAYRFFPEHRAWKTARARCAALGGHLVVVDSAAENAFVGSLVAEAKAVDCWIGITDEAQEGTWLTVTGQPQVYTNWWKNQPNNKPPGEHFALMSNRDVDGVMNWQWSDQPNESPQHTPDFVCEWDAVR